MQPNKRAVEEILLEKGNAYSEAFRAYQVWYPKVTLGMFIRGILLPLKFMLTKTPSFERASILVECLNLEKYKRIQTVIDGRGDSIIHINEISTDRFKYFYETVRARKIFFRSRMQGFWSALRFLNFSKGIHFVAYQLHLTQNLIHYQKLFDLVQPKILACANEDFWFSPILAELARKNKIKTINVMHGSIYNIQQYYDYSVVYGKRSKAAILALASPHTKVILGNLAELRTEKQIQSEAYSKNIVYFDQPTAYPFQYKVKPEIYQMLERLVRDHGYHVVVKLHPSQKIPEDHESSPLEFVLHKSVKEVLLDRGIALGMCSTVGLEVVSYGVPMLYINYEKILDLFLQLIFLENTAVKDVRAAEEKIQLLQDRTQYLEYAKEQRRLLDEEYVCDQNAFTEIFS